MKKRKLPVVIVLMTVLLAAGAAKAADSAAGKTKYEQFCAACHGRGGKGDGPAAAALKPKPRDLSITKRTDAELKKIIQDGGAASGLSPVMPSWKASLSDMDIANVIAHIRTLGKSGEK